MNRTPQIIKVYRPTEEFTPVRRITQSLFRVSFDKVDTYDASGNLTGWSYWYMYDGDRPETYSVESLAKSKISEDIDERINRGFVFEDASSMVVIPTDDKNRNNFMSAYLKAFVDNEPGPITIVIGTDRHGRLITKEFTDKEEYRTFYRSVDSHYTELVNEKNTRMDAVRELIENGGYDYIDPTGVTVSQSSVSINVGGTETLTASVEPAEASQKVIWLSSNPAVADVSVNEHGECVVSGISAGECIIKVYPEGVPDIYAECAVTVGSPEPGERRIVLDKSEINMTVGEEVDLYSTVLPEGSDQGTHAEFDNPIIDITVPDIRQFHITAKEEGKCAIEITSKRYEIEPAYCVVNISAAK